MKITETKIKVSDLVENYKDNGDGGVFGYNDRLTIRPSFQREFIYGEKQRVAVIDSVMNGFPLNVMYWSKTGADTYEVLDGQQRTVSIAQYINKDFPIKINGNDKFFQNLTNEEKQAILDYELTVYICEGTEAEKLEWFKRINIAGEVLTPQELLNATYTGPWLADAKNYFSKRNCVAAKMADGYLKGNPIRQELLEKAWHGLLTVMVWNPGRCTWRFTSMTRTPMTSGFTFSLSSTGRRCCSRRSGRELRMRRRGDCFTTSTMQSSTTATLWNLTSRSS